MIFGRCFEKALAAYFRGEDCSRDPRALRGFDSQRPLSNQSYSARGRFYRITCAGASCAEHSIQRLPCGANGQRTLSECDAESRFSAISPGDFFAARPLAILTPQPVATSPATSVGFAFSSTGFP